MTSPKILASEKKKYLDSVINVIEKTIKNERLKVSFYDRLKSKDFKISDEIARICEKIAQENNIPFSAFEEVFKDQSKIDYFFKLVRFGHDKTDVTEQGRVKIVEEPTEKQSQEPEKKKGLRR